MVTRDGGYSMLGRAAMVLIGFISYIAALSAEEPGSPPQRSFLEIARDKNATPAQKRTVAVLMKNADATSPEAADKIIRSKPELILYGDDEQFITDVSPLASFTHLELLVLYNNKVEDITPLAGLTNLKTLRLERNAIRDIAPLRNLTNLESIQITDNEISDIGALAALKSLQMLWISDNKISDITPLAGLSALSTIYLSGNPIGDLTPLTNLDVFDLRLQNCGLSDISALKALRGGGFLDLSPNKIQDVSPLAEIGVGLINLSGNQIADVSALEKSSADTLDLRNNKIVDAAPLTKMRNLASLDVQGNPIRDYTPLVELKKAKPEVTIVGGAGFEQALSGSIPEKKELQNSPLIGRWMSAVIDAEEFGPLRLELTFEKNGQLTTRLRPPDLEAQWQSGDSQANPPMRSTFRIDDGAIVNEETGERTPFEIKDDTLVFGSGERKVVLQRYVPGQPLKPEKKPFKSGKERNANPSMLEVQ